MTLVADYLQDLQFGVFPTPDASSTARLLALAEVAEVSGLDLFTVQDHPYQSRHLDALTLLTVVAARTSTLRVALDVANRPPVVLAKAIASLDLLSGGRTELGLGAGALWDAVVAAGGPRRTPGEAVTALEEAIAVIRGVWRPEGSEAVRVHGSSYAVSGLHPGPAPAHPVEIWLGAYRPRLLGVTGRLADGWLPSMGYADPEVLGGFSATIDEAAVAAGRDPADVRRLYNVVGRFGPHGKGPHLVGGPADWPSSWPPSPTSTGPAPSSWEPTTPTPCGASARRSRHWCASSSRPSGQAPQQNLPTGPGRGRSR